MRDIFVTLVVLGSIPAIFLQPYIGILMWSWLGYMNPHRISWGFATEFPFAMIVGLVTMIALLFSKESKRIPWTRETILLLLFLLWMLVTTFFAMHSALAWVQLEKIIKIQVMIFLTLILINSRERLHALAWVIVLSLGFYGVKGGIFTITSGGGYHVMGPNNTFIGGNNEIGLALIMTVPLMRYLQLNTQKLWVRHGLTAAMVLTAIAILGTQSRGALLGAAAMASVMFFKSRQKILVLILLVFAVPFALSFMPQSWYDRMGTIKTYDEDESAQGRFRAWGFAFNTALQNPVTGGGFEVFAGQTDAHSIYFEILGEHGFVGLALFLLLGLFAWRAASWVIKNAKNIPDAKGLSDLAAMLQVSLIGYAVGGAFLGLAYFDLYYHLFAMIVLCKLILLKQQAGGAVVAVTGRREPWVASRPGGARVE
ncbi:MAG: putative O-glycosylation ligase, exosortase A system-associated [Gammaproteobacteria bacterium]|nr:putative O-glycosylation ligase, exosortase A system-associated [Gammaproteobacteria bacterium]